MPAKWRTWTARSAVSSPTCRPRRAGASSWRSETTERCSASTAKRSTAYSSTVGAAGAPRSFRTRRPPWSLRRRDGSDARAAGDLARPPRAVGRGRTLRPVAFGVPRGHAADAAADLLGVPSARDRLRLEPTRGGDRRAVPVHPGAATGALRPRKGPGETHNLFDSRREDARRLQKVVLGKPGEGPVRSLRRLRRARRVASKPRLSLGLEPPARIGDGPQGRDRPARRIRPRQGPHPRRDARRGGAAARPAGGEEPGQRSVPACASARPRSPPGSPTRP